MDTIAGFMDDALTFTAALAWNTAVSEFFASRQKGILAGRWLYALVVTVVGITARRVVTAYVSSSDDSPSNTPSSSSSPSSP